MSLPQHLHPATVHFPIALLSLASASGLLYLYWRPHPALLVLTWWPMRLGWLGGAVAVITGLLAQRGLPPDAPYRSVLNGHISAGLAVMLVYGILLYQHWRFGTAKAQKARQRAGIHASTLLDVRKDRIGFTCLALLGLLLLFITGRYGGQLVYEWGVNVLR